MIIWTGFGFVTVVLFVAGALLGDSLLGPTLGAAFGLLVSAAANFWLGRRINDPAKDRLVVDQKSGEQIVLKSRSTLFWLPMEWWSAAMVLAALFNVYHYFVPA